MIIGNDSKLDYKINVCKIKNLYQWAAAVKLIQSESYCLFHCINGEESSPRVWG